MSLWSGTERYCYIDSAFCWLCRLIKRSRVWGISVYTSVWLIIVTHERRWHFLCQPCSASLSSFMWYSNLFKYIPFFDFDFVKSLCQLVTMVTAVTLQQSMVRVNLCAAAGVQSRLNTIVQCVCQEAQWFGAGHWFGISVRWGLNGMGFWGRCCKVHLHLSLTVMIRQRPPVANGREGTVELSLLEQQLRGFFSSFPFAGSLTEIIVHLL